jgi:hypothetical protein
MHFAKLDKSARLRRVLIFLRLRGKQGATTFEIITQARVAAVSPAISELRANGFGIDCHQERDGDAKVFRYKLTAEPS